MSLAFQYLQLLRSSIQSPKGAPKTGFILAALVADPASEHSPRSRVPPCARCQISPNLRRALGRPFCPLNREIKLTALGDSQCLAAVNMLHLVDGVGAGLEGVGVGIVVNSFGSATLVRDAAGLQLRGPACVEWLMRLERAVTKGLTLPSHAPATRIRPLSSVNLTTPISQSISFCDA